MSASQSAKRTSLSPIDKLERQLDKIVAAGRRKLKNENIVRLEKNGDISYETVRSYRVPPASDSDEPNSYPETPVSIENGQQISTPAEGPPPQTNASALAQIVPAESDNAAGTPHEPAANITAEAGISIREDAGGAQKMVSGEAESADPLEDLLARALSRPRRGRPAAFDEHNKGKLVALLSLGMSLRQAAAVLGVSHGTIRNTLKTDPALSEEITAARFQAQLQPLACVIREARRSWKAATWLLKYLDAKIASHEETPDERRERQERESDEFFARAGGRNVKTRRELA